MATQVKTIGDNGLTLDAYQNAAGKTTWIDSNGNRQAGTVADTGNNTGSSTGSIGGLSGNESISELYQKAYEQQVAAANEARTAQIAEAERQAELQKTTAAENYRKANEQLYQDLMQAERILPQKLAALGINGGAAETSEVNLRSGYAGNLSENERTRLQGERDIDSEVAAARAQAQLAAKDAESEAMVSYFSNLIAQKQQAEEQKRTDQEAKAELLASMGDYSGLVSMGIISDSDAERLKKSWIAQNPKLAVALGYTGSSKSGSGTQKSVENQVYEQAVKVFNQTSGDKTAVANYLVANYPELGSDAAKRVQSKLVSGGYMANG